MAVPFLEIKNVTKTFPGVKAVDDISLEINKGEIHVLVGENGAGKSTLIKILTGIHRLDSGEIIMDGHRIIENNPQKALKELGIVPIYQELNLISELDVAENIFMGREIKSNERFGILNKREMVKRTREILGGLEQDIEPDVLVGTLGVGKQQMVEIAKALSIEARLIILDEPTAALGEEEVEELFKIMRQLKKEGVTIIFISHKLDEVRKIGDRLTVLRDGQKVITEEVKRVSEDDIVRFMVGRNIEEKFPKINTERGREALRVENISRNGVLDNISFQAFRGQVLGVAGLVGSGRTELVRTIIGADPMNKGSIFINEKEVDLQSPEDALNNGLVLLTEDRKNQGLFLDHSIMFNCTITNLLKYRGNLLLNAREQKKDTAKLIKDLRIKTPGQSTKAAQLSGGNQQKVVIAKWLNTDADIFIFDEPTRGIDVGAKVEVYNIINRLIGEGVAVIMISSELPEILGMSDRIIVMHEGRLTGEFTGEEATQEKIMLAATGGIENAS